MTDKRRPSGRRRPRPRVGKALAALPILLLSGPAAAQSDEEPIYELGSIGMLGDGPPRAQLGIGAFDVLSDDDETAAAANLELRLGRKLVGIGPMAGVVATGDESVYGYGGLYADVAIGNVVVTPSIGFGAYFEGDGPDLGGTFQFRSSLGVAYEFESGVRLGVRLAHISNAGIHDENPGEEEVYATFSIPLRLGPSRLSVPP